jgi:uncharacterized membrane protein
VPSESGEFRLPASWHDVFARRSGYVRAVDADALLQQACRCRTVVRLCVAVGDYVSEHGTLLQAGEGDYSPEALDRFGGCIEVGGQRTVEQDAAFGLQQLQDIALRALSPGINDPATACMCVNELGRLLARLGGRAMPQPYRFADGDLRVIASVPDFGRMVDDALVPVARQTGGNLVVLAHLVAALERIAGAATEQPRQAGLRGCFAAVQGELARVRPRARSAELRRRLKRLAVQLHARA